MRLSFDMHTKSLENVRNLGTRFLRKISKIEKGLMGISHIDFANIRPLYYNQVKPLYKDT